MRFLSLITLLALAPAAAAQDNRHLFFPGEGPLPNRFLTGVNFATRIGGLNSVTVECLSDVSAGQFRGVGAVDNTTCNLTGQVYVVQDQVMTTQDFFRIIVRRAVAPDGLPDATATGVIAQSANLQLPPPQGTGPVIAWQFSTTWTTPVAVPCEAGYYVGIVLPAETVVGDTLLAQSANQFTAGPPAGGDNPRVPAPKFHSARVDQPAGTAARSTSARTLACVSLTRGATLNLGNVDPSGATYTSFGIGGLYPNSVRGDGLVARVEDASTPAGLVLVFMTPAFFPGGLAVPGASGALWTVPGPLFLMGVGALPGAAPFVATVPVVPNNALPAGVNVTLFGVTVDATFTVIRLTNATAVSS